MGQVLVVEEEESIRNFISLALIKMGCEVTVAGDGDEGLSLFRKGSFDLVLTDLTRLNPYEREDIDP